jgi:hypothetical protein
MRKGNYMSDVASAQRALQQAKERRSAAVRDLANIAGRSNAQVHALRMELKASEVAVAAAERQVALAGVTARIGGLATESGRRLAGQLYGLR